MRQTLSAAFVTAILPWAGAHAQTDPLTALAHGGHVVLLRHSLTDGHANALVLDPAGDCSKELVLSKAGQAQAQRLATRLAALSVKFDTVLASPFCRTRETAQIAFGRATPEPALTALEIGTAAEAQARTQAITARLTANAGKGNVALVTHRPNIDALTMEIVEEGEALVARIEPNGELSVVGRIKP
ncbi:MAG: histidine phosphatase family protein [Burkholderiaceae bacterium]